MASHITIIVFFNRWRFDFKIFNLCIRFTEYGYLQIVKPMLCHIFLQDGGFFQGLKKLPNITISLNECFIITSSNKFILSKKVRKGLIECLSLDIF